MMTCVAIILISATRKWLGRQAVSAEPECLLHASPRRQTMALKQGDKYRCPHENCGCEIEVTKGAGAGGGDKAPRCCCGSEMQKA